MTAGMIIPLEDVNNSGHGEFFVGGRTRLACATAVRLLDDRRLVCTNCVGMRMYLVDYDLDSGTYEFRTELPTEFDGGEVETDLLDVDEHGLIATSNCGATSVSLYRIEDDALHHVRDLPIHDDEADFCHGVAWVPGAQIVCATCIGGGRNVYFLSTETGEVLYRFSHDDWIPRDVCFLSSDRVVVAYSRGYPGGRPDDPPAARFESRTVRARPRSEPTRVARGDADPGVPGRELHPPRRPALRDRPGGRLRHRVRADGATTSSRRSRSLGTASRTGSIYCRKRTCWR